MVVISVIARTLSEPRGESKGTWQSPKNSNAVWEDGEARCERLGACAWWNLYLLALLVPDGDDDDRFHGQAWRIVAHCRGGLAVNDLHLGIRLEPLIDGFLKACAATGVA